MSEPKWLELARAELGTQEIVGSKHNPKILQYFKDVKNGGISDDETPWCAAFVGAMLERSGVVSTRKLNARSYLEWGTNTNKSPKVGDVVVFKRGSSSWQGHVAFFLYEKNGRVYVLGGNQANKVSITSYSKTVWLGYRRPNVVTPATVAKVSDDVSKAISLIKAHRSAITLSEYAVWMGKTLTDDNTVLIRGNRDAMSEETFAGIVSKNYWVPIAAEQLPFNHATFALDTALSHGAHNARKMMQEAAGVTADGIIGPKSVAAIKKMTDTDFIGRLIVRRTAAYQKLPDWDVKLPGQAEHMTSIRDRILGVTPIQKVAQITSITTEKPMTTETKIDDKLWTNSLTIWGTIVTFVSTVLPALAQVFGWDVTAGDVQAIGAGVTQIIQAVGGVIGTVMAVIGRMNATSPVKLFQ